MLLEELLILHAKHPTTKKHGSESIEQATGSIQTGAWQCLDDWELENDDDDGGDDDDAGSAAGRLVGLGPA